jgi:glycosyltransferase involved in cell wall biosynthesis
MPDARAGVRQRLGIRDGQVALLFFGGIRPYKNLDAGLEALRGEALGDSVLIVAGREQGYDGHGSGEPLGNTRRRAIELGVSSRLRLIEGVFDLQATAEIFEAADIVLLPYIESFGSGLLLLAMTFGKFIVATKAGGMDEYLARYPRHTLLEGPSSASVADGIARGMDGLSRGAEPCGLTQIPELEWPRIARDILGELSS